MDLTLLSLSIEVFEFEFSLCVSVSVSLCRSRSLIRSLAFSLSLSSSLALSVCLSVSLSDCLYLFVSPSLCLPRTLKKGAHVELCNVVQHNRRLRTAHDKYTTITHRRFKASQLLSATAIIIMRVVSYHHCRYRFICCHPQNRRYCSDTCCPR